MKERNALQRQDDDRGRDLAAPGAGIATLKLCDSLPAGESAVLERRRIGAVVGVQLHLCLELNPTLTMP